MAGHDAVINCAGYVAMARPFTALVDRGDRRQRVRQWPERAPVAVRRRRRRWMCRAPTPWARTCQVPALYRAHQANARRVAAQPSTGR